MIGRPLRPLLSHFTPLLCARTEEHTAPTRVNEQALHVHTDTVCVPAD